MTKFRIHPTTFLLLLLPFFDLLTWWQTLLLWSSAALHETGHLLAFLICHCPIESVTLLPFGICAIPKDDRILSPQEEVFCGAAGPTVNLFLSALILALPLPANSEIARYVLHCNASLFLINAIPVLPLDGGRVLYFSLLKRNSPIFCDRLCRAVSIAMLLLLLIPACILLIRDKNPSLAMIFVYLTWNTLFRRDLI